MVGSEKKKHKENLHVINQMETLKRQLNSARKKYQTAIRENKQEHIKVNLRDTYFNTITEKKSLSEIV